jgi:hypothetical protein
MPDPVRPEKVAEIDWNPRLDWTGNAGRIAQDYGFGRERRREGVTPYRSRAGYRKRQSDNQKEDLLK